MADVLSSPRPTDEPVDLARAEELLRRAGELSSPSDPRWWTVRDRAVTVAGELVDTGRVPGHLAVRSDDAPILAVRSLSAAVRRLAA